MVFWVESIGYVSLTLTHPSITTLSLSLSLSFSLSAITTPASPSPSPSPGLGSVFLPQIKGLFFSAPSPSSHPTPDPTNPLSPPPFPPPPPPPPFPTHSPTHPQRPNSLLVDFYRPQRLYCTAYRKRVINPRNLIGSFNHSLM